jgi:uncharacterized protein YgiM (DUF1202 family)
MKGCFKYNAHALQKRARWMALLDNPNVSDESALEKFKSYKYHFNPREIIGEGLQGDGVGDLQLLSMDAPFEYEPEQNPADALFVWRHYPTESFLPTTYTVNGDNVRFRSAPGLDSKIKAEFMTGTELTGTGNFNGDWVEVQDSSGNTGWISSTLLTTE